MLITFFWTRWQRRVSKKYTTLVHTNAKIKEKSRTDKRNVEKSDIRGVHSKSLEKYIRRVQPTRWDIYQFIYFCKMLYMFQTVFSSIIRSSKLHTQRQVFVRPLLLPAASLVRLAAGSSIGLTLYVQFWAPDDGRKTRLKHVEHLMETSKLRNVVSCWLYSMDARPYEC